MQFEVVGYGGRKLNTFLYVELNVLSIALILIMYWNIKKSYVKPPVDQQLFQYLLLCATAVFLFDAGCWFLNKQTFAYARILHLLFACVYYMLNTLVCFFWAVFADFKLNNDRAALLRRLPYYSIPSLINAALSLASIKTGWIFTVDANNLYSRGKYFSATAVLAAIYFLGIWMMGLRKKKSGAFEVSKDVYYYIFVFPILPAIGAVFQMMFYGFSLIWVGMLISLFMVFVNMQNKFIYTDELTSLHNRRQLRNSFLSLQKTLSEGESIFLIMVDLDCFKQVNDSFGHRAGDFALMEMANILKFSCEKEDLIARYGGDEFVVLGICQTRAEMQRRIDQIKQNTEAFNSGSGLPYSIVSSIGGALWRGEKNITLSELLTLADRQMYREKCKRKNK